MFLGAIEDEVEDYEPVKTEGMMSSTRTAVSSLPYKILPSFFARVMWGRESFSIDGKNVDHSTVNDEQIRKVEFPSVNANASAEGLATRYSGSLHGQQGEVG